MYQPLLLVHSWFRWIILALMIVTIFKSLLGIIKKAPYEKVDKVLTLSTVNSIRFQFIVGLILYLFLSPITQAAFEDFGSAMKDTSLRYFAVEHIFAMLVGTGLVEAGAAKTKKTQTDTGKFRFQLIFFGIALVVMLSRIPF